MRTAALAAVVWAAAAAQTAAGVASLDVGRWPGGVVPLVFDDSVSPADRAELRRAAQAWRDALGGDAAPVSFIESTAAAGPHLRVLRVVSPDGANRCRATLGRSPRAVAPTLYPGETRAAKPPADARGLVILSGRCAYRSLVHELGHVLGLRHEHERTDRDAWVSIGPLKGRTPDPLLWRNYEKRWSVAGFRPVKTQAGMAVSGRMLFTRAYDPCSVMQYIEDPAHARRGVDLRFTALARRTAAARKCPPGGSGGAISSGDAATVRALYAR
ncbi:MAG TPA: M12 family metallopeptidase [Caulobacteraceae bacterium]|nr:M12 family metallopeptidase [Caulobacteraceae bacterium]